MIRFAWITIVFLVQPNQLILVDCNNKGRAISDPAFELNTDLLFKLFLKHRKTDHPGS